MSSLKDALHGVLEVRNGLRLPRPASSASNSADLHSKKPRDDRVSQPSQEGQAAKVKSVYDQVLKLRSRQQSRLCRLREPQEVNP